MSKTPKNSPTIKAVIFDMDGVIIDTEPLYDQHMLSYLPSLGISVGKGYLEQFRGTNIIYQWTKIKKDFKLHPSVEDLGQRARNSYYQFLKKSLLEPTPGIVNLIHALQNHQYKIALVSSASQRRINLILRKLSMKNVFPIVICGDDVKRSKPNPDIYLKAAELLSMDPTDCVVIEDAMNGVRSAKAAGMKVIAYKATHNKQDLSKADIIINHFKDVTIDMLNNL